MLVILNGKTFIERLEQLLQVRGISGAALCKEIGLSNSIFSSWKKSPNLPAAETLVKIADYFDVSLDWLIKGEENRKIKKISDVGRRLADMVECYPFFVSTDNENYNIPVTVNEKFVTKLTDDMSADFVETLKKIDHSMKRRQMNPLYLFSNSLDKMFQLVRLDSMDREVYELWLEKELAKLDENYALT